MNRDWEVRMCVRPGWDLMDIWFVTYRPDRTGIVHYFHGTVVTTTEFKEGDEMPEPSMTLSPRTLSNLVKEAKGSFPADEQMFNHLQDTRAVRDRLLTIVERIVK